MFAIISDMRVILLRYFKIALVLRNPIWLKWSNSCFKLYIQNLDYSIDLCFINNIGFEEGLPRIFQTPEGSLGVVSKKKLIEFSIKLAGWVLDDPGFH